jgi:hypothetical protein
LVQFSCTHALDPVDRSISLQAVMRPLAGTRQLAVKFTLLQRARGAITSTVVHGNGLGVWITPTNPTLGQLPGDVWHLDKSVLNLDAPAAYRFHVSFRWTGAHGKVLGTARRWSRWCSQRELRPDLAVQSLTVNAVPGQPNVDRYTAVIANLGATGAGPFEVLFAPGDTSSAAKTDTIAFLGAGKTRQVSFDGPVCDSTAPPTITADAAEEVDDLDRTNNAATAVCPAQSTTSKRLDSKGR